MAQLTLPQRGRPLHRRHPRAFTAILAAAWWLAYMALEPVSHALVGWLPLERGSPAGEALAFFLYDAPKVLLLLAGVVFAMGVINTFFTPERVRQLIAGRNETLGNCMAAGLGVVTPFCSCSAVPLFIGFVQAGIPLGVTFSFLVSAPMVNEVALAMLLGMFGWKIASLYLGLGLLVAIASGWVIGRMRMERHLEDWVRELPQAPAPTWSAQAPDFPDRVAAGLDHVKSIVGKVWPYVVAGIAVGALIHGWVPQDFMAAIMGRGSWWSVPLAVAIGVPMYSNAAGVIPVVQALLSKGAALGTVLAFMMSVIALSLPEMIILRRVLKVPLIAVFASVVAAGIMLVGLVFNLVV